MAKQLTAKISVGFWSAPGVETIYSPGACGITTPRCWSVWATAEQEALRRVGNPWCGSQAIWAARPEWRRFGRTAALAHRISAEWQGIIGVVMTARKRLELPFPRRRHGTTANQEPWLAVCQTEGGR